MNNTKIIYIPTTKLKKLTPVNVVEAPSVLHLHSVAVPTKGN
jgi:hypothetical protein